MNTPSIHVKHILVQHEYQALDLLKKLKDGAHFAEVAATFSICSSGKAGGDLGIVRHRQLDPDFLDAALSLKIGEQTCNPIRTRFGYHVIFRLG